MLQKIADVEGEKTVSVMLNGEESEMTFFKMNNTKVRRKLCMFVDKRWHWYARILKLSLFPALRVNLD